jgi:alanine racemase
MDAALGMRATRAIVSLDAIEANLRAVRRAVTPGVDVIAVVKANAYGHGALFVARTALNAGATMLAVAMVSEGVVLRRHGIRAPILVLGPTHPDHYLAAIENSLTLTINSGEMAQEINRLAEESGRTSHVHLKIDTGMHRFGCHPDDSVTIAGTVSMLANLKLEGVFTHFACADDADESSAVEQAERFDACLTAIAQAGIPVQMRHAANSAATLRSRRFDYDAVRLGIALYGLAPSDHVPLLPGMSPALKLISHVARVSSLEAGERVSYGGTYIAEKPERIALIPCGYGDGYRRLLSNTGWVSWNGVRLPIRGRVCMDQMMVGVPDGREVAVGDEVTLIGPGDDASPTAEALGELIGTINYEVVTTIAARVPRVYTRAGQIVGVDDLTGPAEISASAQESRGR